MGQQQPPGGWPGQPPGPIQYPDAGGRTNAGFDGQGGYGGLWAGQTNDPNNPSAAYYTPQHPYTSADPRNEIGGFDWGQQYYQNLYQGMAQDFANRQAPGVDYMGSGANADYSASLGAREGLQDTLGREQGLEGTLGKLASGQGQTAADYAFQSGLDKSIAAQQASANTAHGGAGAALAQRQAAMQGAAMQQQAVGQLGQQKFGEQVQGMGMLAGLQGQEAGQYGAMRGQDLASRGQGIQMGQFGANLGLQQEELNQQGMLGAYGLNEQMNEAQLGAFQRADIAQQQADTARYGQTYFGLQDVLGAAGGAGGAALGGMGSDEDMKMDINSAYDTGQENTGGPHGGSGLVGKAAMGIGIAALASDIRAKTDVLGAASGPGYTPMQAGMAPMGGAGPAPVSMPPQQGNYPYSPVGAQPPPFGQGITPAARANPAFARTGFGAAIPPHPPVTPPSPWMGATMAPAAHPGISGTGAAMRPAMAPLGAAPTAPARPVAPRGAMAPIVSDERAKMDARRAGVAEGVEMAREGGPARADAAYRLGQLHREQAERVIHRPQDVEEGTHVYAREHGRQGPYAPHTIAPGRTPIMQGPPQAMVGRQPLQGAPTPVAAALAQRGVAVPPGGMVPPPPPPPMAPTPVGGAIASDERMKVKAPVDHTIDAFLDAAEHSRATYRYKAPQLEPTNSPTGGKYAGVMAQELEMVPEIGHQLVKEGPQGKYLEGAATHSASLAALGRLHARDHELDARLRDLEMRVA